MSAPNLPFDRLHIIADSCVDTGHGCVPAWQWYWFWSGMVVGALTLGLYWRFRSIRLDRVGGERTHFQGPNSSTYRKAAWAVLIVSLVIAAAVGVAARSFWLAVDVLFSEWGIAYALLLAHADRWPWANSYRDWFPARGWYALPLVLLGLALVAGVIANREDVNALKGLTAGLAAAAAGTATLIAIRRGLNHPQGVSTNTDEDGGS